MSKTYIDVPFAQKDRAKSLGARWDAGQRQWYVPPGVDIVVFQEWLPAGAQSSAVTDLISSNGIGALAQPRGVSLSQLLAGVAQAVASAYREGVWTRAEVLNVSVRNGHVYLELSERDAEGRVLAKALGTIWARTAERILGDFERITGAQLAPGIKLLVQAKPVVKAQYGLSIDITGIEPSYTLGDLEAQKRKIREELVAEQLFDRNRKLPPPWDFTRVLVVAPENAAGLGDFAAEAIRLQQHGLCEFVYAHSRFQGEGAALEVLKTLKQGLERSDGPLDAVAIIRGGGAVNDLAWLNDYQLARFICVCDVPVLTGIGHERDSTILDEVAHRSFDTPSKVAAGIEKQIRERARQAMDNYAQVLGAASRLHERASARAERLDVSIRTGARDALVRARQVCDQHSADIRLEAVRHIHDASVSCREMLGEVKAGARQHLQRARLEVPSAIRTVQSLAVSTVREVRSELNAVVRFSLTQAGSVARSSDQDLRHAVGAVAERARQNVASASAGTQALMREIAGQGPDKTLSRGFAVVSTEDGKTVTTAAAAAVARDIVVRFGDGKIAAVTSREP